LAPFEEPERYRVLPPRPTRCFPEENAVDGCSGGSCSSRSLWPSPGRCARSRRPLWTLPVASCPNPTAQGTEPAQQRGAARDTDDALPVDLSSQLQITQVLHRPL